jgi:hypothetical protein
VTTLTITPTIRVLTIQRGGATPTGPAGGDLGGGYPNPTVAGVRGLPWTTTAPTDGQVAKWDQSLAEIVWATGGGGVTSITAGTGLTGGTITTSGTIAADFGTAAGTVCQGNDSRLSDARTPTAHKTTHSTFGNDALSPSDIGAAASSHTHGNITNAGAIGSTSGLPIITTTSGVLTTGAFGTTAGTFAQGNDSRLSDSRTPTGAAGGDLSGTYPNPTIAANSVVNASIADDEVTYNKLQQCTAHRLLGRGSGNGTVQEIPATAFAQTLLDDVDAAAARTTLGISTAGGDLTGTYPSPTVAANAIGDTKLRDSAALSVIGRSANTTGDPADIAAGTDGHVLRRAGTALGFGTIATAGIGDDQVTYAKIQNVSATDRILGRSTAGAGDIEEIVCTAYARGVLDDADSQTARTTLGVPTVYSGTGLPSSGTGIDGDVYLQPSGAGSSPTGAAGGDLTGTYPNPTVANDAITYAKMQNVSATDRLLGRATAGSGNVEEIACTSAGRALIDDADATAQRATMGVALDLPQVGPITSTITANINGSSSANQRVWHMFLGPVTGATLTVTANRVYYLPIFIPHITAVRNLRVYSSGTVTTGNVILGIYDSLNGVPNARQVQTSATAVTSGTGYTEIGINWTPTAPGWYWLAAVYSSTPTQFGMDNGAVYTGWQGHFNIAAAGRAMQGAIETAGSHALPATAATELSERNTIPYIAMSYTA